MTQVINKTEHFADNERLRASLDNGTPDLGTLWELCVHFEFDREKVADGIASWIGSPDGIRILDCACGSGLPALDLIRRGYDVTCSDGSEMMLEHFRRNAKKEGVTVEPHYLLWEDLDRHFADTFDVVMCRGGGSYLYAGTWDADTAPKREELENAISQFVSCVRRGGRLYIDITRAEDLANTEPQWTKHPLLRVGAHDIQLEERVTADVEKGLRIWHTWMTLDGVIYEFERRSHYLTHEELISMLKRSGLEGIQREEIPGEHYEVYSGLRF